MAIRWKPSSKRKRVEKILSDHDAYSSRCDQAALEIFPLANEQDTTSQFWLLRPAPECGPAMVEAGVIGILALPEVLPKPPKWTYHVCVETELHCVCSLTGPDGCPNDRYIIEKFQYPEVIRPHPMASAEALRAALDRIGRRRANEHG
ncbi:MAG TPA: hypothetical protein VLS89_16815 [Candidatus Nanopelagicales bacterium]|nr:hypothetical protein [Candidatus Nanopelagicales bacterium]